MRKLQQPERLAKTLESWERPEELPLGYLRILSQCPLTLNSVEDHAGETGGSLKVGVKHWACTKEVSNELVEPMKK